MLKPLFILFALLTAPAVAAADAELAREWGAAASALYEETVAALDGAQLSERYEDQLARFAVTADRLGSWNDASGGPDDLGCIFRGMADETELQLTMLHMPGRRQSSLRRLATLFHDAESISLAAALASERPGEAPADDAPASCAANPQTAYQYLTEQP